MIKRPALKLLMMSVSVVAAAAPPADVRNFIACPEVRDTKSVPCWLAQYQGETYFLVLQSDVSAPVNPPWLGHKVLVEGRVSDKPNICGGIVLEPVVLSVMPDLDASCNTMLPAEERYNLTFEPPRPPGPSGGQLAFRYATPVPAKPGDGPKQFTITFDFNGGVVFRHPRQLMAIMTYAQETRSGHVEITGYRGSTLLSNGDSVVELPVIARKRAEQVATLLRGGGLGNIDYKVSWQEEPLSTDGVDGPSTRRVTVLVTP